MAELATTWTAQSNVYFNQGTLAAISDCQSQVDGILGRGTLSASTTPTSTETQTWIIQGKEILCARFGFTWRRRYSYMDTAAGTFRYALPKDFAGGSVVLRDLTQNIALHNLLPLAFDSAYPDPAGSDNSTPTYYTIKDRELWFSSPADSTYRLELEYDTSGDDSTATDVTYLPEMYRFHLCDFAAYRGFMRLQQWEASNIYKAEWERAIQDSKSSESKQKYSAVGYRAHNWHNIT